MRCSTIITVVFLNQIMTRQVFSVISDKNWFVNGSQTCKTYTNQTNLATNAALHSDTYLNTTFYYMTNVSDFAQNLHLIVFLGSDEETKTNLLLEIKIGFENDFNDLIYQLKTFQNDSRTIAGKVPLPQMKNNVILSIDLSIQMNMISQNATLLASTNSGENENEVSLIEYYYHFTRNYTNETLRKGIWSSFKTNTCTQASFILHKYEIKR